MMADRKLLPRSRTLLRLCACTSLLLGGPLLGGPDDFLEQLRWRSLGPAVHGGRVVDIAVHPKHRHTLYVAAASGGIWKSENNGTTWKPIFERAGSLSMGDIAIAPSNPKILWAGTGEANNQRSSYWGDGVYRSDDAGKTWRNMGLRDSHHIGRIVIHPKNPDIVYVAALGHLYSFNAQRGVFKTVDGGRSWKRVLFISERVGVVDLAIDPDEPDTLYAASYERLRRAWHFDGAGPGSGIYKSSDGGSTWRRLGGGLPSGEIGRIGLAIYPKNPKIIYAAVSNQNPAPRAKKGAKGAGKSAGERKKSARRPLSGEVYRSEDGGESWVRTNSKSAGGSPAYYYGQIRVDPTDDKRLWVLSVPVLVSSDGGKTFRSDGARGIHVDNHALWIDPADSRRLILGNDGGLHISNDRGAHWDFLDNLPIGQYYAVTVDQRIPYNVYGGTQDNGTWMGPSHGWRSSGTSNGDWTAIGGGDGFFAQVDPSDPNTVYVESQFGGISRVDLGTGQRRSIRPRPPKGERYRFNWNSPIHISPHNPWIVYFGGNKLFRSLDRGDHWEVISPDLSSADAAKLRGNVPHCTITAVAESPRLPGLIWVGTDDGRVQVTRDGGHLWRDVAGNIPGVPPHTWVTRVVPSHHDDGTAYVTLSGYRDDDFRPYVYRTSDFGESWDSLAANLPQSPLDVLVEDERNPDLLFVGAEYGVYMSLDRGERWLPIENGLPQVAVYDMVIQDRDGELVIGTHGRGFYALDFSALRDLSWEARRRKAFVGRPRTTYLLSSAASMQDGFMGQRGYRVRNAQPQLQIGYSLGAAAEKVSLEVRDESGELVKTLEASAQAGIHIATWDLRRERRNEGGSEEQGPGQGMRGRRFGRVEAGRYTIRLVADGTTLEAPASIVRVRPGAEADATKASSF